MALARRFIPRIVLGGLLASLVACSAGSSATPLPVPSGALVLRVVNAAFQPSRLGMTAGQPFALYFDNADNQPHNVVVLGPDNARIVAGAIFSGPAQRTYAVPALASGTYQLHCDVHPEMHGTITVP